MATTEERQAAIVEVFSMMVLLCSSHAGGRSTTKGTSTTKVSLHGWTVLDRTHGSVHHCREGVWLLSATSLSWLVWYWLCVQLAYWTIVFVGIRRFDRFRSGSGSYVMAPAVAFEGAGGLSDSIDNGRTGLLARSPEDFTRAVRDIVTHPTLRDELGARAAAAARRFSWAATVDGVGAVLGVLPISLIEPAAAVQRLP